MPYAPKWEQQERERERDMTADIRRRRVQRLRRDIRAGQTRVTKKIFEFRK
jgi:hypothetical protein